MQYTTRIANRAEWAQLLEASESDYSLSQTYEFGEAVANAYDEYSYEPRILELEGGVTLLFPLMRIRRRPGFIRSFEAMPFCLNGSPISVSGALTPEQLSTAVNSLRADSVRINLGGLDDLASGSTNRRTSLGELRESLYFIQMLNLAGGFDDVWTRCFSGKVRQQCRMAERKGVEISTSNTLDDFDDFYSIYARASALWGYEVPPYPRALFHSLSSLAGSGVELKMAKVEGRSVAGILLLHGRRTTFGWIGAMLKEYARYHLTVALFRSIIGDACRRGMAWYDFGAYGKLDSVRGHKERYGAQEYSRRSFVYTSLSYRGVERLKKLVAAGVLT